MTSDPHTNHCCSSADARRSTTSRPASADPQRASVMNRILAEAASDRCDRALALADSQAEQDPQIANARGVCLLRLGRAREAVALYRSLLFTPGCTVLKSDRPAYLKLNYATALLLSGQPDACLDALQDVDARSTVARRLRDAIQRWETTLSFSQKLDWWINRVAPSRSPLPIDFTPGEFGPAEVPDLPPTSSVLPTQPPTTTYESIQSSSRP